MTPILFPLTLLACAPEADPTFESGLAGTDPAAAAVGFDDLDDAEHQDLVFGELTEERWFEYAWRVGIDLEEAEATWASSGKDAEPAGERRARCEWKGVPYERHEWIDEWFGDDLRLVRSRGSAERNLENGHVRYKARTVTGVEMLRSFGCDPWNWTHDEASGRQGCLDLAAWEHSNSTRVNAEWLLGYRARRDIGGRLGYAPSGEDFGRSLTVEARMCL